MNDNHTSDGEMTKIDTPTNTMDDLQYRRSIYADPASLDDDILAAQNADPSKKRLAEELILFDEKIKEAMNIPVPDDLCNKLLLRQSFASHQQEKRKSRVHLNSAC